MDHLIDHILCVVVKGIAAQINAAEATLGERICQESRRSLAIDQASNWQSPSYAVLPLTRTMATPISFPSTCSH